MAPYKDLLFDEHFFEPFLLRRCAGDLCRLQRWYHFAQGAGGRCFTHRVDDPQHSIADESDGHVFQIVLIGRVHLPDALVEDERTISLTLWKVATLVVVHHLVHHFVGDVMSREDDIWVECDDERVVYRS